MTQYSCPELAVIERFGLTRPGGLLPPFFYAVTLRDGSQALPKPWDVETKLQVFALERALGVQGVEAGFPRASSWQSVLIKRGCDQSMVPPLFLLTGAGDYLYNSVMNQAQTIVQYLNNCLINNHLAHAYLMVGADTEGQAVLLRDFWAGLLQSAAKDLAVHPDFKTVAAEGANVTIEQVRELRHWLHLSSLSGLAKVAVILGAGAMNTEAQNAFLKILEEPEKNTYLFLLAGHEEQLLPTIRSRAVVVRFEGEGAAGPGAAALPWNDILAAVGPSERLRAWLSSGAPKEELRLCLAASLPVLRQKFLEAPNQRAAQALRSVLRALAGPSGQNWQLIIENTIISL